MSLGLFGFSKLWVGRTTRAYRRNWWVFLGDMGTGKTSLVLRYIKGQFHELQESTIGAAFFTQIVPLETTTVKFDIWDTAGQERYHSLAPMYYRGAAAAVVVYDITSKDSFARAKKWVEEVRMQGQVLRRKFYYLFKTGQIASQPKKAGNQDLILFVIGNKADLEAKRKVAREEGEHYATENGIQFLETSAKTAQNVDQLFLEIAKNVVKVMPVRAKGVQLQSRQQQQSGTGFCCS